MCERREQQQQQQQQLNSSAKNHNSNSQGEEEVGGAEDVLSIRSSERRIQLLNDVVSIRSGMPGCTVKADSRPTVPLKVLSSEMDPAESRLIR
jgi:hypothetical protein